MLWIIPGVFAVLAVGTFFYSGKLDLRNILTQMTEFLCQLFPEPVNERERLQSNLYKLAGSKFPKTYTEYRKRRMGILLKILLVTEILACVMTFMDKKESVILEGNRIARGTKEETQKTVSLIAETDGEKITTDLVILPNSYTTEELEAIYDEFLEQLLSRALGQNETWDCVEYDLKLASSVEGYPFTVLWESSDFRYVSDDGKIADYAECRQYGETEKTVRLTVLITYGDYEREEIIAARIVPAVDPMNPAKELKELIYRRQLEEPFAETVELPLAWNGQDIQWKEQKSHAEIKILICGIAAAGVAVVFLRKQVEEAVKNRERKMMSEYASFVSKMTLYIGAGMNMRGAWEKIAAEGTGKNPLYEEMKVTVHEMENGIPETKAYEQFGIRSHLQPYIRLTTLLSQNLKKGNSQLLVQLKQETAEALEEQYSQAKSRGEELSTKMLFPMMLMMGMVMLLVMVPAFLSF